MLATDYIIIITQTKKLTFTIILAKIQISFTFCHLCLFSALGFYSGTHAAFSCHNFFMYSDLWHFLGLLLSFMNFTLLKSTYCKYFFRMSLSLGLSVFFGYAWLDGSYAFLEKTTDLKMLFSVYPLTRYVMSTCHISGDNITFDHLVKVGSAGFSKVMFLFFPFPLINNLEGDSLRLSYFSLHFAH